MSGLLIQHGEWVVVCDGAKALVLENTGDAKFPNLKTLEVFEQKDLATTISDLVLPAVMAASRCLTNCTRKARSAWSCQSVCSIALRRVPAGLMARPGTSSPSSWVAKSFCLNTSRVLRLGNLASPVFSSTSALAPSHTTTHSPCWINKPDMDRPPQLARHPRTAATIAFCSGSNAWARDFVAKGLRQLVPSSNRRAMT